MEPKGTCRKSHAVCVAHHPIPQLRLTPSPLPGGPGRGFLLGQDLSDRRLPIPGDPDCRSALPTILP